jgi:hypothetical protein
MTLNIKKQKEIAKELLDKLEVVDPYVILAGGAPRDWYLGEKANDLDFYVHVKDEPAWASKYRLSKLGLTCTQMNKTISERVPLYESMEHLRFIYEGDYKGMKYQVMFMSEHTFSSVVPKFGASVCEAYWKGGDIIVTNSFLLSHYTKTLFKKDNYTAKESHISKMLKKYPDYTVVDETEKQKKEYTFCECFGIFPSQHLIRKELSKLLPEYKGD